MAPQTTVAGAQWSLRLFGGFDLTAPATGESVNSLGKRERVLLAFRAARRKLATLLWGDATDDAATDNLRVCVFNLRKALGRHGSRIIASEGKDLVLDFWRAKGWPPQCHPTTGDDFECG